MLKMEPIPSTARGGFGCVFSPGLPCSEGDNYTCSDCISKLVTVEEGLKEINNNAIVQKLDPGNEWHLKLLHSCPLRKDIRTTCPIPKVELLLFYPRMSYNLNQYLSPLIDFPVPTIRLLEAMIPIARGLATLSRNGYVHFDVKEENILVDIEKLKLYLIDFGLMTNVSGSRTIGGGLRNTSTLHWIYPFHPPESFVYQGIDEDIPEFCRLYIANPFVSWMIELLGLNPVDHLEKLQETLYNFGLLPLSEKKDYILKKADVFGLSYILVSLYRTLPRTHRAHPSGSALLELIKDTFNLDVFSRVSIEDAVPRLATAIAGLATIGMELPMTTFVPPEASAPPLSY